MSDFLAEYLLREHLPSDNFLFYNDCYYKGSRNGPFFDSKIVPLYEGLDVSHGLKLGYYRNIHSSRAALYTRYNIPKEELAHEIGIIGHFEPNNELNHQEFVKDEPMCLDSGPELESRHTEKTPGDESAFGTFRQLEEGYNKTTTSWFERSVLQPYEPVMRRVIRRASLTGHCHSSEHRALVGHQSVSGAPNFNGATGNGVVNGWNEMSGHAEDDSKILVEHRWSHLFRKNARSNDKESPDTLGIHNLELVSPNKDFPFTNLYATKSPYDSETFHGSKHQSGAKYIANIPLFHTPSVGIAPIDMATLVLNAKVLRVLLLQCEKGDVGSVREILKSLLNYELCDKNWEELSGTLYEYIKWFKLNFLAWQPLSHECIDYLFEFEKIDQLTTQLKRAFPDTSSMLLYKVLLSVSSSLFMPKRTDSLLSKTLRFNHLFCRTPYDSKSVDQTLKSVGHYFSQHEHYCNICRTESVPSPSIMNEYINFGGSPVTQLDMELGTWSHSTSFATCSLSDIPTLYSQQVQYSTKKYLSLIEDKNVNKHVRNNNYKLERIFSSDTSVLQDCDNNGDQCDEHLDLVSTDSDTTVANKPQHYKGFTHLKLEFSCPYANIELHANDEKDVLDNIRPIVNALYSKDEKYYLAPTNGFHLYEDGYPVENILIQSARNNLFGFEYTNIRNSILMDIIASNRQLSGTVKPSFLLKAKHVTIGKSKIHGYGLFAVQPISKGELILEYAGVVITEHLADILEREYDTTIGGSTYLFRLDQNYIVDSTLFGNSARFINHSCNPNTMTTNFACIEDDGFGTHVGIYASRDIMAGEELYYNYRLSEGSNKKEVCYCGDEMCQGYMSITK